MELRLRNEGLEWRAVEEEIVVLDVEDSVYLAANQTGAMLWKALAAGTTRAVLVALLIESFGITTDQAEVDVDRFLSQLTDRGLLES